MMGCTAGLPKGGGAMLAVAAGGLLVAMMITRSYCDAPATSAGRGAAI